MARQVILWLICALVFYVSLGIKISAGQAPTPPPTCEENLAILSEQHARAQELVAYYGSRLDQTGAALKKAQGELKALREAAKPKPEEKK